MKKLVLVMVAIVAMMLGLNSIVQAKEQSAKKEKVTCSAPTTASWLCPLQGDKGLGVEAPDGLARIVISDCGDKTFNIRCLCGGGKVVSPIGDDCAHMMSSDDVRSYCLQASICQYSAAKPTAKKRDPVVDFDEPDATQNPMPAQLVCMTPTPDGTVVCTIVAQDQDSVSCRVFKDACGPGALKSGQVCLGVVACKPSMFPSPQDEKAKNKK